MAKITHRYATAADVDRYYGEHPEPTTQAIVILLDDEPAGMAGITRERDRAIAFSEYKPALEPYLKTMPVLRAVKAAQKIIRSTTLPVLVFDSTNPALMERLGFRLIEPGVHLCLTSQG